MSESIKIVNGTEMIEHLIKLYNQLNKIKYGFSEPIIGDEVLWFSVNSPTYGITTLKLMRNKLKDWFIAVESYGIWYLTEAFGFAEEEIT